jgi:hypothetical protein
MNEPQKEDLKKLHREDIRKFGAYWVIWDVDLQKAIAYKYRLSALEILIFQEIAMYYDSHNKKPCAQSYRDFSKTYGYTQQAVKNGIEMLLEIKLILQIEERKGTAKSKYVPNVERLHEIYDEYFKDTKNRSI